MKATLFKACDLRGAQPGSGEAKHFLNSSSKWQYGDEFSFSTEQEYLVFDSQKSDIGIFPTTTVS